MTTRSDEDTRYVLTNVRAILALIDSHRMLDSYDSIAEWLLRDKTVAKKPTLPCIMGNSVVRRAFVAIRDDARKAGLLNDVLDELNKDLIPKEGVSLDQEWIPRLARSTA